MAQQQTEKLADNSEDKHQKAQDCFQMMSQTPHAYSDIDPLAWQKEQRTDKPLPHRD